MPDELSPTSTGSAALPQSPSPIRRSIRWRLLRQFILLAVFAVLLCASTAYLVMITLLQNRTLENAQASATAKETQFEELLHDSWEITTLLAQNTKNTIAPQEFDRESSRLFSLLHTQRSDAMGLALVAKDGSVLAMTGATMVEAIAEKGAQRFFPVIEPQGWTGYIITVPVKIAGHASSTLSVSFSAQPIISMLFGQEATGTEHVVLARQEGSTMTIVADSARPLGTQQPLERTSIVALSNANQNFALALSGAEGGKIISGMNGGSIVAYRFLPTVGWAMTIVRDQTHILQELPLLADALVIVTAVILFLAVVLAHFLARDVSQPLMSLSTAVEKLDPQQWSFQRSLSSGDEVEFLEGKIDDMAARLRKTYDFLESEVAKRTEDLRQQAAKDRTILTSIHHGIIVCDVEGIIQDCNPAACTMLNHENVDLIGKPFGDLFVLCHHQKVIPLGEHPIQRCLGTQNIVRSEPSKQMSILRLDHSRVPIMLIVSPLMVGDRCRGAIAVFHDITEERKLDYMKSEFISLASHQLRTPLSAITWYLELLTSDDHEALTDTQKMYIKEMYDASTRMAHLIDDLLHASVLEDGNITPTLKPADIVTIVRESAENSQSQAKDRSIGIAIALPTQAIMVQTDPTLVQMIINNLLSNAVKYSKPGSSIAMSVHPDATHVEVRVEDHGVGIPEEDKQRIFGRLFRASNVVKMDTNGTGLGLYISHLIAGQLGGSLTFQSTEGVGTTFTLRLPTIEEAQA